MALVVVRAVDCAMKNRPSEVSEVDPVADLVKGPAKDFEEELARELLDSVEGFVESSVDWRVEFERVPEEAEPSVESEAFAGVQGFE